MDEIIDFRILPQPTETTCGPSCLHAVYGYYGDTIPLEQVIGEVKHLESGGTLAVFLACHALRRGYSARIYTYNLSVFDPTWFAPGAGDIRAKLEAQKREKHGAKLRTATEGYLDFLSMGGELRFEDLTASLLRKYLKRGMPIITGLSSTFLYRSPREVGYAGKDDDIRGEPAGHFVVLRGYNREDRTVMVADPFYPNPFSTGHQYVVNIDRVLCAILLGVLTHDANFLIVGADRGRRAAGHADPGHR